MTETNTTEARLKDLRTGRRIWCNFGDESECTNADQLAGYQVAADTNANGFGDRPTRGGAKYLTADDLPKPAAAVGVGASWTGYSDRYAGTIVKVTAKTIQAQEDKAELLNGFKSGEPDALTFTPGGFCGHVEGVQRYAYTPDPDGEIVTFTLRSNGHWVKSKTAANNGPRLRIGTRNKHHDYNF
jgi:hypothetical protein